MTFYSNDKRKTYVLNPRGKPLYEDANRFGTKMLEKMGWSRGKGLGVNLNGEQNFIKVSHKADQKGIGFEDRDDQWTQHENQFNSLLKSLDNSAAPSENEDNDEADAEADADADELSAISFRGFGFADVDEKPSKKKKKSITDALSGKSLEEMSKNSKARLHYKKFMRGKDLSKYSEKDLANIFGKKSTDEASEKSQLYEETAMQKNADLPLSNYGITTIETGTTISDYFQRKKTNLLKGSAAIDETNTSSSSNSQSMNEENQQEPEKKRKKKEKDLERVELMTVDEDEAKKEKKSKKKKEKIASVEMTELIDGVDDVPSPENPSSKKKNKKKKREYSESETVAPTDVDRKMVDDSPVTKIKKKKSKKSAGTVKLEVDAVTAEVTTSPHPIISNILSTLIHVNNAVDSSSTEQQAHASVTNAGTESSTSTATNIPQFAHETFEINRYQAELFRFVDLDGFNCANLSDLTGYGFSKTIDLKITARTQDRNRINDLWDNALINKYGKDVIKAKKKKKYSLQTLKKKKLFKAI